MRQNFIFFYKGQDNQLKLRLLKEKTLSPEINPSTVEYFKKESYPLGLDKASIHVFFPLGGKDDLDFTAIDGITMMYASSGKPSCEYLADLETKDTSEMYKNFYGQMIDNVLAEKTQTEAVLH
jgi:hypothetical protein